MKLHYGNLIEMLKSGEIDVLIHGCNNFHTMGAGIAKHIRSEFPQAYEADKKTAYGDIKKLGTFSEAIVEINNKNRVVINAYTQHNFGGGVDNFSYETFPKLLKDIKEKYGDKKIGLPLIGCGLAGGDEQKILTMIKKYFDGVDYKLVEIDKNRKLKYVEKNDNQEYEFFFSLTSPFSNFHPSLFTYLDYKFLSNEHFFMFSKAKFFKDEETAEKILNIYNQFMISPGIFKDENQKNCYQLASNFLNGKINRQDILKNKENIDTWNTINKKIKALGREVKNYDDNLWSAKREKNMIFGARLKFNQNDDLKQILLDTKNKMLIEASKYDSLSTMQHVIQKLKEEFSLENKRESKIKP